MNLTNMTFKQYAQSAKIEKTYDPQLDKNFLEHCLPLLASVPLKRNPDGLISPRNTFNYLRTLDVVQTPIGNTTGQNIADLIQFLYFVKRANLIDGSQTHNPKLATLTPIPMYAHKLYNDVKYSEWDKNEKWSDKKDSMNSIEIFLGKHLSTILEVETMPKLKLDDLLEYRKKALMFKTGAKKGTPDKVTSYKMSINGIDGIILPRLALVMYLQTWLANASIRVVDSMILDPLDWDNIPEPLDAIAPKVEEDSPWS